MNVSLWYSVAFHTHILFSIETCMYCKQCRFNMILTRTCLFLNMFLYINTYVYASLDTYASIARDVHVYISGSKSSAYISTYIIVKHRHIGVRRSGYTHIHNKIHVWEHIHTCTHIYTVCLCLNKNADVCITLKVCLYVLVVVGLSPSWFMED